MPKFLSSDIPTFQVNLVNQKNLKTYIEYIGVYWELTQNVLKFWRECTGNISASEQRYYYIPKFLYSNIQKPQIFKLPKFLYSQIPWQYFRNFSNVGKYLNVLDSIGNVWVYKPRYAKIPKFRYSNIPSWYSYYRIY